MGKELNSWLLCRARSHVRNSKAQPPSFRAAESHKGMGRRQRQESPGQHLGTAAGQEPHPGPITQRGYWCSNGHLAPWGKPGRKWTSRAEAAGPSSSLTSFSDSPGRRPQARGPPSASTSLSEQQTSPQSDCLWGPGWAQGRRMWGICVAFPVGHTFFQEANDKSQRRDGNPYRPGLRWLGVDTTHSTQLPSSPRPAHCPTQLLACGM